MRGNIIFLYYKKIWTPLMFYYEVSWFLIICSRLIFWMGNPSVFKTIKEFSSIYREAPDFINLSRSSLFHQSMQKLHDFINLPRSSMISSIYREAPDFINLSRSSGLHQSIKKLLILSIYREAPWFHQSVEKLPMLEQG